VNFGARATQNIMGKSFSNRMTRMDISRNKTNMNNKQGDLLKQGGKKHYVENI
jgi:hypothetical protein